jgi:hypothetical protein
MIEQACEVFEPVRDQRGSVSDAVTFVQFRDGHFTDVRVQLSSAADRECAWVFLEFPAGPALGPNDEVIQAPKRREALHLCRCMAAELYAALDRAFGGTLSEQQRCPEALIGQDT